MNNRSFNVFLVTFAVASAGLFAAWFAVDGLVHLDEFFAAAGPGGGVAPAAIRHFSGVVHGHGGTLLAAVGLASALVAVARVRRAAPVS